MSCIPERSWKGNYDQSPKYDLEGTLSWVKGVFSDEFVRGTNIAALSDGDILMTGVFGSQSSTFGKGEQHETVLEQKSDPGLFVARYTADGEFSWVNLVEEAGEEGLAGASAIAALPEGAAAISGSIQGVVGFGQTSGDDVVVEAKGKSDSFILRYEADGTVAWIVTVGGDTDLPFEWARSTSVVDGNSILVAGYFVDEVIFTEDTHDPQTRVSSHLGDGFLMRLDPIDE